MFMNASMHFMSGETLEANSALFVHDDKPDTSFVTMTIKSGASSFTLYLRSISDVDRLASELETLARAMRESGHYDSTEEEGK